MSHDDNCGICRAIKAGHNKVYEDDFVFAAVSGKPASAGHVVIVPKHHSSFEDLPEKIAGHLFVIANKISKVVFESLGAQGTNILLNDGKHTVIDVIPRRENDGLNFDWPQKESSEDDLKTAELMIKEKTNAVGIFEKEKKAPVEIKDKSEKIESDDENYLVKQLRRIP